MLIRLVVDPDPLSGTLGAQEVHNPGWDDSPLQGTIHTRSHLGPSLPSCMFWGYGRKPENLEETRANM